LVEISAVALRQQTRDEFVPVDLRFFVAERPPIVDLFIRLGERDPRMIPSQLSRSRQVLASDGARYVLYSDASTPISRESRARLLDNGVNRLYYLMRDGEISAGGRSLADILALSDTDVPSVVKTSLVYENVLYSSRQVLTSPASSDMMAKTARCVHTIVRHVVYSPHSLHALINLMRHDESLFTHSANVCTYAAGLGRMMGMQPEALAEMGFGALVHDVGMTKVPQTITGKAGPLTAQEREIVQNHPKWGAQILAKQLRTRPLVQAIILQHHERLDGTGYPAGLTGDALSTEARVVAFVDKYEALTSDRPFRPAMNPYKAMQAVRDGLVGQFEQELFVPMLRMLGPRR
jgi:HD-GYP domain-containing protein (c-di-GMP phosphodiesterase class II)